MFFLPSFGRVGEEEEGKMKWNRERESSGRKEDEQCGNVFNMQ